MTPHVPEEFTTRLIDRSPFVIMGNTMPPRDPDEDDEDDDDEEDRADEPPVVREPEARRVGRSAEESRKILDGADIALLGLWR